MATGSKRLNKNDLGSSKAMATDAMGKARALRAALATLPNAVGGKRAEEYCKLLRNANDKLRAAENAANHVLGKKFKKTKTANNQDRVVASGALAALSLVPAIVERLRRIHH